MKNFFILAIAFFALQIVSAQEVNNNSDNKIYDINELDVKPEFPGGMNEFYKFVGKNYQPPLGKNLSGKIYVSIVIEKDGSLADLKVLRDIGYGAGKEAIRVLLLSPKWVPGELNFKKVRSSYILPIAINSKG
jgi:protein TonB